MSIQSKIEEIKVKRASLFLPNIEKRLQYLEKIEKQIDNLDSLMSLIQSQCDVKQGPYYNMLVNDAGMEMRLHHVSTSEVKKLLAETKKELERLKQRFSRKSISLQVFGMAGSGKSTFIQSVTGLSNDVVLASEGGHCTGVSSFIYNADHFETRVYLYTRTELLGVFNKSLSILEEKYAPTQEPKLLQDFAAIKTFEMANVGLPNTMEGRMSVLKYVQNYDLISNLLSGKDADGQPLQGLQQDEKGRYYVVISNPEEVQKWVAQHNGHHSSAPEYVAYLNYLAVDHVDIYKKFNYEDVGDIVLMDNVGLGDAASDVSTEEHMYQAIADNSDAVILLYQPKPNSGWRGEEETINSRLNSIRYIDVYHGEERMDVNELYFLLNERNTTGFDNSQDCPEVVKTYQALPYERKETILIANAANKESVRVQAIEPILRQLTDHLESIDARKISHANDLGQKLYASFQELSKNVAKVVSGSMKQGSNELKKFRELYQTDLDYSNELKKLDNQYAEEKDIECPEVKESIENVIASLTKLIDKPDTILVDVEKGKDATNAIFEKYVKIFRNRIYEAFAGVNTNVLIPLQEKVKDSLTGILFTNAKFGKIPLQGYAIEDGASQEWLKIFIDEKVDKDAYPKMFEMLCFVLDYKLNIQGLIEYHVAKCLNTIDKHNSEFRTMNPITGVSDAQHAKKIWSEIVSRATSIQNKMRVWRDDFSLIPSHSFYARISMYRDMMVDDTAVEEELYNFYSENRMAIWRDVFASMILESEAFGNWNEVSKALTDLCVKNEFITKID